MHLEQIAAVCNIDIEQLRALNPSYRRDIVPGATEKSAIRLAQTDIGKFIDNEEEIYNHKTDKLLGKRPVVEVNDIPQTAASKNSRTSRSRRTSRSSASAKTITIRSGQTLSEIAKRHGTTVAKLKKLNNIKGTNIRAGKKLRVR